ncbi:MAG TPA: FKBP-type peptidyl-prolyl cis-trans isomerase [archaeon]|nr:FKBP-type peptidyl-prolyl cis-trans isomerase [archaeon]
MKQNSIVLLEFTGRELESGRIFDSTSEQVAKDNGFWRENAVFGPVPTIVGRGDILAGLEDAVREMKEGESRTVKLAAAKAFGERRKELVVIVPLQQFRKRNIQPLPGLVVDLNGSYGKVQTVSGGRVRVDLNSDLAGKEVEYELKIVREVKDSKEKAQLLTEKFFPLKEKAQTMLDGDALKVKLPKELAKNIAPFVGPFSKTIKDVIPEIKKVEIVESFEVKPVKDAASKKAPVTQK